MRKRLVRIVYLVVYYFVSALVRVGDATRYILYLPLKFFSFLFRHYVIRAFRLFVFLTGMLVFYIFLGVHILKGFAVAFLKSGRYFYRSSFKHIKEIKIIHEKKISKPEVKLKSKKIIPFIFRIKYFFFGLIVMFIIVSIYQSYLIVKGLPSPKTIGKYNYSLSTHIYDRNGKLLYEFYREQNRTPIKLNTLPPYIYEAAIAFEDKDFFKHNGVSIYGGIVRAVKETLFTKSIQGGSTITQQLVKSALLTPERTIERKIKEIILALWTEKLYAKKQILQMYLNQVPYGGSAYGIEEAARSYFEKQAKDLTLDEAALLAGLPQAPSRFSPFVNPRLSLKRRNGVLNKMLEQKYITKGQYEKTIKKPLKISSPKTPIKAPHFVFYVRSELEKMFGIRTVEEGGLRVSTTLDLTIQKRAEEILREELGKIRHLNVQNGGILVTRPATGEILAMVGSADYFAKPSGAFNVTSALRQPGSSIKPLMYSLALERGYTAVTIIDDSPVIFTVQGQSPYRPVNYDGRFHGRVTLRQALANSYNVPAVKTLNMLGVQTFVTQARRMGITTWEDSSRFGLSLTLGGGEVTMIDMAKAYGVFANNGKKINPSSFIKITNSGDETVFDRPLVYRRVLDEGVSYIISDILSDNIARRQAFGARSFLEIPGYSVAVKTGTTDNKKDNWTIGYTPEFVVVVWVGNNDNTPMHPFLTSGITGAAPIWRKMMDYLLVNYSEKNSWFSRPDDVVEKLCGSRKEFFIKGTEKTICGFDRYVTPTPKPN